MWQKTVKQAGFKLTRPRLAVVEVLEKAKEPITAKQIHQRLKSSIDLVSVYRTLNTLKDLQIVFGEEFKGEQYFYIGESPHHHIVCRKCGKKECVPCHHQFSVKNFKQISHQLVLTGVCSKCLNN